MSRAQRENIKISTTRIRLQNLENTTDFNPIEFFPY